MTGYPWYAGETLTAADLNAAFGAVSWHAGSVTALGSNLTLTTGTLAATVPVTSVAGRIGAVTLAVADVSGAAPLASPALTGTPTAPTATLADNSTKIATTAFVLANSATAVTAAQIAALNFSSLPTSNPGGGKLWLNGGVLQVGA